MIRQLGEMTNDVVIDKYSCGGVYKLNENMGEGFIGANFTYNLCLMERK